MSSLVDLVESVRAIPYGRPAERTVQGMLREGRGTCSAKHLYLYERLTAEHPETDPRIVHRVYTVQPQGIVDVHRYLTAVVAGRRITLDVTFPAEERWDGVSPMPLACEAGQDFAAGDDPDAEKRALEDRFCDPAVREPYIASLSS